MELLFSKYSGCGNDFILIDDREETFPIKAPKIAASLCQRRQGIGADGIILLQKSDKADFRMRILNSDGSEAEMCGNGIRCLLLFINELGFNKPTCTIETLHRIHRVALDKKNISVEMGDPLDIVWNMEVPLPQGCSAQLHWLNTGVPHVVEFVENLNEINIKERGWQVRNHPLFSPKGTNYNAAAVVGNKSLVAFRTYERGVEEETLACGTGATAVALAAAQVAGLRSPIKMQTRSGEALKIYFDMSCGVPKNVWMAGPAHKVYSGKASMRAL